MRYARSEKVRLDAATALLDRSLGRPMPSEPLDEDEILEAEEVSDEALAEFIENSDNP